MSIAERPGYSASVDLQLHCNSQVLSLSSVGPEDCTLAVPMALPTGKAEIVVIIDGKEQRRSVELLPQTDGDPRHVPLRGI